MFITIIKNDTCHETIQALVTAEHYENISEALRINIKYASQKVAEVST